eukprot:851473-Pleurochrysis_carterae.AAC.1
MPMIPACPMWPRRTRKPPPVCYFERVGVVPSWLAHRVAGLRSLAARSRLRLGWCPAATTLRQ